MLYKVDMGSKWWTGSHWGRMQRASKSEIEDVLCYLLSLHPHKAPDKKDTTELIQSRGLGTIPAAAKGKKTFLKFTCAHRSKLAVNHSVEQLLKLIAVFPIIVFKAVLNFSKSSTLPSLYYIKYALWGTEGVVGHFQALVPCEKTVPSPVTLVRTWWSSPCNKDWNLSRA